MTDPDQRPGRGGRGLLALLALPVLYCLGHTALLVSGSGAVGALASASRRWTALAATLALAALTPLAVLTVRRHRKGNGR